MPKLTAQHLIAEAQRLAAEQHRRPEERVTDIWAALERFRQEREAQQPLNDQVWAGILLGAKDLLLGGGQADPLVLAVIDEAVAGILQRQTPHEATDQHRPGNA